MDFPTMPLYSNFWHMLRVILMYVTHVFASYERGVPWKYMVQIILDNEAHIFLCLLCLFGVWYAYFLTH